MSRKHCYFSLEEANAAIPTLEYYFSLLMRIYRDLAGVRQHLLAGGAQIDPKGIRLPRFAGRELASLRERYFALCHEHDHVLEEILSCGVEVVDLEAGLVNFYCWWDGEEVVLSWQYGEPTVQFWCDPGEPYTARRPIRQLFFDAPAQQPQRH